MTTIGKQQGGEHYNKMGLQPWQAFEHWLTLEQHQGYLLGDALAYLARFNATGEGKGGLPDVRKAIHCLQRLVEISEVLTPQAVPVREGMWAIGGDESVVAHYCSINATGWVSLLGATHLHYYPGDAKVSLCRIRKGATSPDFDKPFCNVCSGRASPAD